MFDNDCYLNLIYKNIRHLINDELGIVLLLKRCKI